MGVLGLNLNNKQAIPKGVVCIFNENLNMIRQIIQGLLRNGNVKEVRVDDNGRVATYPYQVRDLCQTAYVTTTTGAEATLFAGDAAKFLDVLTITGATTSGAAQTITIRSGTAGSTVDTFVIPASSSASKSYLIPLLQSEKGQIWTYQNTTGSDISTTTVALSATGIKND